ncbi:MAG TPA: MaoC family dehydratase [Candidatus Limnocylindrales bacterium]|nr:MaoC family dehydratase [Candidatus Limnocylindrales bacterium]
MNINGEPVYVGRDFGGREVAIDAALVERYVRALGHRLEIYSELAPALTLHSECYENLQWYLANIWGNLHARQEWELFGEVPLGSHVRTRGFIRDRYRKRGRDYVVKETWVQDADGNLLSRGLTHQSFLIPQEGERPVAVDKDREKRSDRTFEIGGKGRALAPLGLAVSEDVCMAFSGPTENYHTNRDAARALGFPDIVVQGMLPICLVSELLTREYGRGWLAGGKMDVRLVNVLWADEHIEARAEETSEVPEAGRTRVHLDVWVEKTDGTRVIVGTASALR